MASEIIKGNATILPVTVMNLLIAQTFCPGGKGWAWTRHGIIDFADPSQTTNLSIHAQRHEIWNSAAPARWYRKEISPPPTVAVVYHHLCLDHAEKRLSRVQIAYHFRNLVAEAIEEWRKNAQAK